MDSTKQFIQHLTKIQEREGYTDLQMSNRLGCSRSLFQMTRTGKIPLSITILKGSIRAFPELKRDAYIFLTNDASVITNVPTITTTPHETPSQRFLGALRAFRKGLYSRLRNLGIFNRR